MKIEFDLPPISKETRAFIAWLVLFWTLVAGLCAVIRVGYDAAADYRVRRAQVEQKR